MRELNYIEKVDIYPASGEIYYSVNDQTVNYVVPVCPGSTYTVTLTEIGNRLRSVFTTANPLTTASNITGCTDIVMNPTFDVGYTFSYTPSSYGFIVVYVSNIGEHPKINITTDGVGGDDKYTIMCVDTTSTTLTATIYARKGDYVLCSLTTRSETTLPEDWTVLHVSQTTTSSTQHMTMLYKKVEEDGVVSFAVTQASSGRIYINLIAFSDIGGFAYKEGCEYFFDADTNVSFVVEKPPYDCVVWGMSANLWSSGRWTCDEIPALSIGTTSAQRQGNIIDDFGAGQRTFVPKASDGSSGIIVAVVVLSQPVEMNGSIEFSITDVQRVNKVKDSRISWIEAKPEGTSVNVFTKLSTTDYVECKNGEKIKSVLANADLSTETLFVKVELSTESEFYTPSFSNLLIEIANEGDDKTLVFEFGRGNVNNLQNAVDAVSIKYADGTLAGYGGQVDAFEFSFMPENLAPKNHPAFYEHVELPDISVSATLTGVDYITQKHIEHVNISASVVGVLTNIADL